jgi:hypothetical protein
VLHCRKHTKNVSGTWLESSDSVFKAYEIVFNNPAFIATIGEEKLRTMMEKCLCAVHFKLASMYAAHSQPEKALYHLNKVNMRPSSLGFTPPE